MDKCEGPCSAYCDGSIRKCKECKEYLSPNEYSCINFGGEMDVCDECIAKRKK